MRVVATFHPSSSVVSSVKCNLTANRNLEHLVVAKVNRLEVFSLQAEGLRQECGVDIWGRIIALRAISAEESGRSNLLVLTDHPEPKLIQLTYEVAAGVASLVSNSHIDLQDRYARPAEFVTDVLVDPSGKVAAVSCYTGRLKVVRLEDGKIGTNFDVSIPELFVLGLSFLYTGEGAYALAILHYDHQQRLHLLSRDLDLSNLEVSAAPSTLLPMTILSSSTFPSMDTPPLLIPVPPFKSPHETDDDPAGSHLGGLLIVGGRKVLFFEHASQERQEVRREKQRRTAKRLSAAAQAEAQKAREKEKEREGRKVKPRASVKWPWSEVTAWCAIEEEGRRYLLGDAYGRLAMLCFDEVSSLLLIPLGETSPTVSLTYLTSQVLYLGSHFGDSQLLRIHLSPYDKLDSDTLPVPNGITTVPPSSLLSSTKGKQRADVEMTDVREGKDGRVISGKGSYMEVLQNYQNIAPIMDAVLADLDGSGQPQIVTCSGGRNTGALKVVRTGADFQELAVVEGISNVTSVWPVRSRFEDSVDTHLVASTLYETYVFCFSGTEVVTRLDPSVDGFIASLPTLALANIPRRVVTSSGGRSISSYVDSSLIAQVTSEKVRLVEYDAALGLFSPMGDDWDPNKLMGRSIVAASVNASQFVLGLSGGRLALLNLGENTQFKVLKSRDFIDESHSPSEISAISCCPFDSSKNYATHIAISFWGTNKVMILSLESSQSYMSTICEAALPSLARSLLLHNFGAGRKPKEADYHPHLLAGMADGTVVSFRFKEHELKDEKVFALGTTPVSLATCKVDGRTSVFASGSRASVLFWDRHRLHQSPVMLKDTVRGTSLNASLFPSCLVLASASSLLIGNVRGVDKMQIRSIMFGLDNPRHIAYHPALKIFGVAFNRIAPPRIGDYEESYSSVKIFDKSTFNQLAQFVCEPGEEISAILALPVGEDHSSPCFCIGTVQLRADETEPSHGRIIAFAFGSNEGSVSSKTPILHIVAMTDVQGCVYQLANVDGMIAAAVNTSVMLFKIQMVDGHGVILNQLALWDRNYFVTSLVSKESTLIVGDPISSVSVLRPVGTVLRTVARDYSPLWPVAIEAIGTSGVIGANSDCNLFTFTLQRKESRSVLERDGSYYLGDVVNKFIPGGLASIDLSGDQTLEAKHLFFTSTGSIGVILELSDEISLHMTALQRNMAKHLIGVGDIHHTKLRAPANSRGRSDAEAAFGFLDGDFVEQFLSHPHPVELLQGEIEAERITLPQARIRNILEKLQSLH
ncbi:hypothetical protein AcV5_007593 [Taiwanofungus camphoratus]|nr:hypothetical protein AcW2_007252 [Antrodia cinnamomea]KAI0926921.1 hypothetical protein AcV5_007593 [Antrodia cinnamomea]